MLSSISLKPFTGRTPIQTNDLASEPNVEAARCPRDGLDPRI
jgi:hypothetical protein